MIDCLGDMVTEVDLQFEDYHKNPNYDHITNLGWTMAGGLRVVKFIHKNVEEGIRNELSRK